MSFTPRPYPDIVRDVLTTLTGGTVREQVVAPTEGPVVLDKLADRPIRRVSHLEGTTLVGDVEVAVRFTDADFELVDTDGSGQVDAISFRDTGRRPAPGSTITVNYYPVETRAAPLTDLNVGSVVRTMLESIARELALEEQYLDRIYRSAFLETAEGPSLDRVVALVGVSRLPAGHPIARVRVSRNSSTGGRITVPAGTVVTDADANRYLTSSTLVLEPGETSREVAVVGATKNTVAVAAGALDRLEVLVAGVSSVTNPEPAARAAAAETDDVLRRRASGALHGAVRGTLDALRYGILGVPGVKDVTVTNLPNGVAGEVGVVVAYERPGDVEAEKAVNDRLEALRPAGIRIVPGVAEHKRVHVTAHLVLTGTGVAGAELDDVTDGVERRVTAKLAAIPPGGTVRTSGLVAAALEDGRVADATLSFADPSGTALDPFVLDPGQVLDIVQPFAFPSPVSEEESDLAVATTSFVDAVFPVAPAIGVTMAEVESAIDLALVSHLSSRSSTAPLTVDGVATAVRDESRFALDRVGTTITVEHQGRFVQLIDDDGSYRPGAGETMRLRTLDVMGSAQ